MTKLALVLKNQACWRFHSCRIIIGHGQRFALFNISKSMKKAALKKGGSSEMGNHTPLSLLRLKYSQHKVYEGIKGHCIHKHVIDRGLASSISWGFVKGGSTELLMLHLTEVRR